MSKKNRGFSNIIGATITHVDTSCINEVKLFDVYGNIYIIEAEDGASGIPVIKMTIGAVVD